MGWARTEAKRKDEAVGGPILHCIWNYVGSSRDSEQFIR